MAKVYHPKIEDLIDNEWEKIKENDYFIFLKKEGKKIKVSLNSGMIVKRENIKTSQS